MSKKNEKNVLNLKKITPLRFLVLDVDGVMTDGQILYSSSGEEVKSFNAQDGAGLKYWSRAGHAAGIITGRTSPMVTRRAEELSVPHCVMGAKDKLPAFEGMLAAAGVTPEETAVIADDLPEIPLLRRAGFAVAVGNAVTEVKDAADYVTAKKGGRGAVREIIEVILKAQGRWDGIMEWYLR